MNDRSTGQQQHQKPYYSAMTMPPIALLNESAGSPLRRAVKVGCFIPSAAPTIRRAESPIRGGVDSTALVGTLLGGVMKPLPEGSMEDVGDVSLVELAISDREELIRELRVGWVGMLGIVGEPPSELWLGA